MLLSELCDQTLLHVGVIQHMDLTFTLMTVVTIWGIGVITPGPNFFIIVNAALTQSRSAATLVVLGTCSGTVTWGLAGFFGITLLFQLSPWLLLGIKLAGGAYLVFLGVKLVAASLRKQTLQTVATLRPMGLTSAWRLGFLTNLGNPKAMAFVSSIFAAAMPANPALWLGALSIAVMVIISLVWYLSLVYLFSSRHFTTRYQRSRPWLDRISGLVFIGFGLRLATHR